MKPETSPGGLGEVENKCYGFSSGFRRDFGVHDISEALLSHWFSPNLPPPNPDKPVPPHKIINVSEPKKVALGSPEVTHLESAGFLQVSPHQLPVPPRR